VDVLLGSEAVIAALKNSGDYDDVLCDRIKTVLIAPHKHKGREARKTKETGTVQLYVTSLCANSA